MAEELKFEKAMAKLEKIVEDLENGNIALDDALKKYEEGVRLSAACQKTLKEAEQKIEILTQNPDGSFQTEDFDEGASPAAKNRPVKKKKSLGTKQEDDKDFLI